jgi:putative sigma-54 modulation protein
MKLTVTGRNIEITDAIRSHLDARMNKTIQDLGESADVHISLHVEKHRHMAEVTVKTNGFTVHADEETKDLYMTMDNVLAKIEKQLKKHKERSQDMRIKKGSEAKSKLTD